MSGSSKVAIVAGYGVGISAAVAQRFGAEGYKLALLARTQSRLDDAVADLAKQGITAKGYATDLSDTAAVRKAVAAVHDDLGPISIIHWNPYMGPVGKFMEVPAEAYQKSFDVSTAGLVAAVQAAHDDLKSTKGALLVTGGGLSMEAEEALTMGVNYGMFALAVPKAAQRKLVHMLHKALAEDGIYVAEVTVCGMVRGTAWDPESKSSLTGEAIADKFWELAEKRDPTVWFVTIA